MHVGYVRDNPTLGAFGVASSAQVKTLALGRAETALKPPFTRRRRIRRWIRTGALLTVVGLMPLARAWRGRRRPFAWLGRCSRCGILTVDGAVRARWRPCPGRAGTRVRHLHMARRP